jgi:hypothetical protein
MDKVGFRHPRVTSMDGQARVSRLEIYDKGDFLWSPTDDLLISVGRLEGTYIEDAATASYRAALIDPESDTILAQTDFEIAVSYYEQSYPQLYWTADGAHAIVSYQQGLDTSFYVFSRDGQSWERHFRGTLLSTASASGFVIYKNEASREIRLYNLITDEADILELPIYASADYGGLREYFTWNPQGTTAVFIPGFSDEDAVRVNGIWLIIYWNKALKKLRIIRYGPLLKATAVIGHQRAIICSSSTKRVLRCCWRWQQES